MNQLTEKTINHTNLMCIYHEYLVYASLNGHQESLSLLHNFQGSDYVQEVSDMQLNREDCQKKFLQGVSARTCLFHSDIRA